PPPGPKSLVGLLGPTIKRFGMASDNTVAMNPAAELCRYVVGAAMFGFLKKPRTSSDFWAWLAANTSRLQSHGREAVPNIADDLSRAFEKSYPGLVWEITPSDSGPWVFCVSADGNRELFDRVRSAVNAVPKIPGWEIKAFRQR